MERRCPPPIVGPRLQRCGRKVVRKACLPFDPENAVSLRKPTKKLLQVIKGGYASDARHELAIPVRGEIDVRADGVPGSAWWFGELREADVSVVPLQDVDLKTHQERTTDESVRAGGAPVVTERPMLDGNRLPPGKYLMVVTLRGNSNWDRQVLFFEVAED